MKTTNQTFKKSLLAAGLLLGLATTIGAGAVFVNASDHDDGESEIKGRNLNLTDLYVFRESDQNPAASPENLVLIMDTNPRSVAGQQYYFSTRAKYKFNISRVSNKDATPTGLSDVVLEFEFGPPKGNNSQDYKMTITKDGSKDVIEGQTTALQETPILNTGTVDGSNVQVFAGLREDPFFFDVEQFFRVRAGALGKGPAVGFRDPATAVDFTKGYNVNAIAVQLPIDLLQGSSSATTFDVWMTVTLPGSKKFNQVERLARPAINEGLIVTNDFLNTLNSVDPAFEAAILAGQEPAASAGAPIVAEAKQTLLALGNSEERANALLGAFLPDVMRIDTTGPSGYASAVNAKGSPIRGRLLLDDVVDITLSVLTNGAITSDGVSYQGTTGNQAQGHDPLEPAFPYLAPAN
ncbi:MULTISPECIES: DUF4331 domain-containing protein [Cyanophyceae]|uniref:DUF4331 domain-containing protein n=1 Tax=Cyanophyceae TaxID=3028117 RepID=UPI001683FE88|nr:DUF4331 domain-containing protein [Phormidium sp. FACHB-322]MBD1914372.1 DUF4331 domain-containing protein [Phormidium sp. FACHB-77]MBD2028644.1 DUF4331 domain-containing protein [Phormidium sp. FACHB-322]MBD2053662.1 DUF4331 domain-containing protein [Leptolyngbya sp. FACHB-60]